MSVDAVKYLTHEYLKAYAPETLVHAEVGMVYPIITTTNQGAPLGMVHVVVVLNTKGMCAQVTIPQQVYNRLESVPTHSSVANELRRDARNL